MSESTRVSDPGTPEAGHGEKQGSVALYIWIGAILAVLTFVEVAVYLIEAFEAFEVPLPSFCRRRSSYWS
jgi:hypothetical protein